MTDLVTELVSFIGQVQEIVDDAGGPYGGIEQAIKIAIAGLSILLFVLALSAYRRTRMRRLWYAAAAFGLFAGQMLFEYLEDAVAGFEAPYNDVIFLGITLGILVLFFLAVVRKDKIASARSG
jgi:uncharacterized membrane protein